MKGGPSRTIASLELPASWVGLILLSPQQLGKPGVAGTVAMTGFTDSQVSSSVVTKGMTTAYPLCVVAMEMAAQLEHRGIELFLEWAPREQNREADCLADGDFTGFSGHLRVQASLEEIRWVVLPGLLRAGAKFYEEAKRRTCQERGRAGAAVGRQRKGERLREREPW